MDKWVVGLWENEVVDCIVNYEVSQLKHCYRSRALGHLPPGGPQKGERELSGGILEGWWPGGWKLGTVADRSLVRVTVVRPVDVDPGCSCVSLWMGVCYMTECNVNVEWLHCR
jgi:hypothetical protein